MDIVYDKYYVVPFIQNDHFSPLFSRFLFICV